jgi:hypothetical protein
MFVHMSCANERHCAGLAKVVVRPVEITWTTNLSLDGGVSIEAILDLRGTITATK